MPFPTTTEDERPAVTLSQWWIGSVHIAPDIRNGTLTAIAHMRKGDETGPSYHPADGTELRSMDLVGEFAEDADALQAIAEVTAGLELLASKLMDLRGVR